MTIDLSQFVNQEVIVTYANNNTQRGVIKLNSPGTSYPFLFADLDYTKDGCFWESKIYSPRDIKSIRLAELSLEEEIAKTQEQLQTLQNSTER